MVTVLHPAVHGLNLANVGLGAAAATQIHTDRFIAALAAFFLAVGISAHALDELNGRPLKTELSDRTLIGLAAARLLGRSASGSPAASSSLPPSPFVVVGGFFVVAYNLELFGGRFHTDFWLAFAWAAFPALTSWWINTLSLATLKTDVAGLLVAAGCFGLVSVQRRLSTPVRRLRRKTVSVSGEQRLEDGTVIPLTVAELAGPLDESLRGLSWAVVVLAAGLVVIRY